MPALQSILLSTFTVLFHKYTHFKTFIAKSTTSCYFFKQRFDFYFLISAYYASVLYSKRGLFFQINSLKRCFSNMLTIFIPL